MSAAGWTVDKTNKVNASVGTDGATKTTNAPDNTKNLPPSRCVFRQTASLGRVQGVRMPLKEADFSFPK